MPAKHDQMRGTNTLLVLEYIRHNGESTRRSIQKETGLSWAAVSTISTDLISKKVLMELPCSERVPGRNPVFLDFVPKRNLTLGIEINAEGITALLLDLRCDVVDHYIEPLESLDRDWVIDQMIRAIELLMSRNALDPSAILGIGIATQGTVDRDGAISVYNSFFNDWRNVPLKRIFEERFGIPVHVMHDPACIALAEQWNRRFTDKDNFAVIRLSYGIGMSHIVQGKPVTGSNGIAGELGHMVLDRNGPLCSCGNRGCMESYSSIRGLAHRIIAEYHAGNLSLPESLTQMNDRDIEFMSGLVSWSAAEAAEGNEVLLNIFDDAAYFLGVGIANVVSIFDPNCIILTGGLLDYQDLILDKAKTVAKELAWSLSEFEIIISREGRSQAAVGAALYFINDAFSSLSSRLI
ncbi:MAG: ROK family protein [Ruminococcaceae bacterium]|nr:ROK family protein [Oscillospiraceae bacterium]